MRIFLSGPSGVGKSTIIKAILERQHNMRLSISFTTRPPRPGEVDGRDYFFVTAPAFQTMIDEGRFLEWAHVHEHHYGTSLDWVMDQERQGYDILFDIDVQGVAQAQALASPGVYIMILPPDLKTLELRLTGRATEDRHALAVRLENARKELRAWNRYQYLVVNDKLDQAITDIQTIIAAQRLSAAVMQTRLSWLSEIA